MQVSPTCYEKLQSTYDNIVKQLRSLEALVKNFEKNLILLLIQSKFPNLVLETTEWYGNNDDAWTVKYLRNSYS